MARKAREQGKEKKVQEGMAAAAETSNGDTDLVERSDVRYLAALLVKSAVRIRESLEGPLPIPEGIVAKAENMGIPVVFSDLVRARVVAAVMERMGKTLTEKGKKMREELDGDLLALLKMMEEESIQLEGLGKLGKKEWRGASFDKEAMTRALLNAGVEVATIQLAMAAGTKEYSKDVLEMRWERKKKEDNEEGGIS